MPKYRSLTTEELEALQKEFVDYLVANGIAAEDWEKLKREDADAAERIVDLFSDVIMEGVLRKTTYLEVYFEKRVLTFKFDEEEVGMMAMESEALDADFTDPDYIAHATAHPPADLQISSQRKAYARPRSEEIWDLIQQGCTVSDGKLYEALSKAKS